MMGLTARRVRQILYNNRDFLAIDREWEQRKQIQRIKRHIVTKPKSVKDVFDWERMLHDKITPEAPMFNTQNNYIIKWKEKDENLHALRSRIKEEDLAR